MGKTIPLEERLWSKFKEVNGCWIWTGSKDGGGYGNIVVGDIRRSRKKRGKSYKAHRLSYEFTYGDFDKKLDICHTCDNPSCINPEHLFAGTRTQNMQDCSKKGRTSRKGTPKEFRIISPDGILIQGFNLAQFCRDNGLIASNMSNVINGKNKSHKGYTKAH